jgi:hypothetical protein
MTVTIILTAAGTDTGPFNLFSDLDGFTSAFETGISRASLLAGYTSYVVPNGTNTIRVVSTGACKNYIDINVSGTTTTTTTVLSLTTEINIINNTTNITIDGIFMDAFPLPPGSGLYPTPGNTYLTSYPSGTYSVTVTLLNVPNNGTTVYINDGDIIQCFTFPAGVSSSHTFTGVHLTGLPATITVNTNPC